MSNLETRLAWARFTEQHHQERGKRLAAKQEPPTVATDEHREMKNELLFRESFGHARKEPPADLGQRRWEVPQERPWDRALRLATAGTDDDAPRVPEPSVPAPVPAVTELPPQETRARQLGTAEELFDAMARRLQHTPEAATLPPDVQIRRAFRDLPGSQREAIAAKVEAEDYALPGYFAARNYGDDYTASLVSSALAKRYADARRLQPELSPTELLQQIAAAAAGG